LIEIFLPEIYSAFCASVKKGIENEDLHALYLKDYIGWSILAAFQDLPSLIF